MTTEDLNTNQDLNKGKGEDLLLTDLDVQEASTVKKLREIFYSPKANRKVDTKLLITKWETLFLKEVEEATTFSELKELYANMPIPGYKDSSNVELVRASLSRWVNLCSTIDEIKEVIRELEMFSDSLEKEIYVYHINLPGGNPVNEIRLLALKKWLGLCTSTKEFFKADMYAASLYKYKRPEQYSTTDYEMKHLTLSRFEELLDQEILVASTPEEAQNAFRHCPDGSSIRKAAIRKWDGLSLKEVQEANTLEEVKRAIANSRSQYQDSKETDSSEAYKLGIKKLYTISPDYHPEIR